MKKIISLILTLMFLMTMAIPGMAYAEDSPSFAITPSSTDINTNDIITVTVSI